ncbi:MAG: hypothetical protein IKV87_09345 [Methanobrevibacter sp.]|nr:hypothetical protein [Methanobrevibacter sp.]
MENVKTNAIWSINIDGIKMLDMGGIKMNWIKNIEFFVLIIAFYFFVIYQFFRIIYQVLYRLKNKT